MKLKWYTKMFTFVIEVKLPPCIKLPLYCAGSTYMISCPAHMCFFFGTKCQLNCLSIKIQGSLYCIHILSMQDRLCFVNLSGSSVVIPQTLKYWIYPGDIEILDWCPANSVLFHGEKVSLQPWLVTVLVMMSQ